MSGTFPGDRNGTSTLDYQPKLDSQTGHARPRRSFAGKPVPRPPPTRRVRLARREDRLIQALTRSCSRGARRRSTRWPRRGSTWRSRSTCRSATCIDATLPDRGRATPARRRLPGERSRSRSPRARSWPTPPRTERRRRRLARGRRHRHRRLRHGLLVARLPRAAPVDEVKIDRSFVLDMATTRRRGDRALDHRPRAQPRARGGRRGRGDRGRATTGCRARLRRRPGILAESPTFRRRGTPLAGGVGQRGEPGSARRALPGGYFPMPAVSPRTKKRCPERKSSTTGAIETSAPARISGWFVECGPGTARGPR